MNSEPSSSIGEIDLPSIQTLQAFERAATLGSFALAAKALNRTPSAISHAVRDLEERYSIALFERVGRSVKLTAAGAAYLQSVSDALDTLTAGTKQLISAQAPTTVRLSALPFFTSAVLLPNYGEFERRFPKLDLRIETSNAYADLANNEVEAAIRFGDANTEGLAVTPLIDIGGLPVCSPTHLASAPSLNSLADLQHHTLIHISQNADAWQQWLWSHDPSLPTLESSLRFDSILGALDAAKRGLGIVLAMDPIIRSYPGFGTDLVPALEVAGGETHSYNFVCRKSSLNARKIQNTLSWLKDSLAPFQA